MKNRHAVLPIALLLVFISAAPALAAAPSLLQAGAAAVDISPKTLPALKNGGFLQAIEKRIADPLHARSLVLSDGEETLAIVIVDTCMFPTTLCDEIKRIASAETGIPANRILISATHTHTAPAAMECLGCPADESYLKFVPAQVARAIGEAHKNLQPAKLGYAVVDGSDFTNCRRWITRSDRMGTDPFGGKTVRAMMHPGYQNPNYTSPAGPVDPWLTLLSVVAAKDDAPIFVMANLSMHYFGGGGFSADYFGDVARLFEAHFRKTNSKSATTFVGAMSQGTSGDLHWMDYSKPRRSISRQQFANAVAKRALNAWEKIEHRADLSIAMAEKRLTINRRTPSLGRLEWARPINAARLDKPPRSRIEVYAKQAQWMHENPKAEVVLKAVRIGGLGITAIPNEVYGITGLKLKRQSPLAATMNLELANGATGYIPPPEQHRLGGYTTWPASTAGLVATAEPLIVETLLALLEAVAEKPRRPLSTPASDYAAAVIGKKPIAYWRLDDMVATQVEDAVGKNHARFQNGVALFLPGPESAGMTAGDYGNRSVYLAGGHIEARLDPLRNETSVSLWFSNQLPVDARDVAGVLLSTEAETVLIAGKAAGEQSGKLILKVGGKSIVGKSRIGAKHWHSLTLTRNQQRVRVFLNGSKEPEIDIAIESPKPATRLLIGSDGNAETSFDGKVDDIAVFARALKADEIAELYQASAVTAPPQPKPIITLGPKRSDANSRQKYADAVMASKPVAFWRLHDEPGQIAKDSAGKANAEYEQRSAPLQANAAKPNFTGGRVKSQLPKLGDTYSVELWFRNDLPVQSRPVTAYLFSRAAKDVEGASGDNLGIGGTHSHAGRLILYNGNEKSQLVAGPTPIKRGGWSHVVMVRQNQKVTVYLNGDPKPEIAADLPIAYPADCEDLVLGGRADNFANLQGMLEEVAVFDRALTPQEVKVHFEAADVQPVESTAEEEEVNDASEKPQPTTSKQSLKTIHVPAGYQVQLVAAEPLVKDPVAIDWAPDGKLWVVEMADYPLGLDNQGKPGGRVRFLEDTTGDGQYDKSTLFAEGLSFPNGVLVWGRGVLVTAAPEIIYLEDSTGDGKADVKRVLYAGFLEGNQQLRVNGLRYGLDNWIYCASGSHNSGYGKGSQIKSLLTGKRHQVGSRDFRIRPESGAIDPQSGPSQFGRSRDDWGNWFGVQNSHPLWHYVLADHHIRRNPNFAPPDPTHQVVTPANPRVYPASTLQKRYHSFSQSGRFTSACSPLIYRDDLLFDRGAEQHAFTCEPFHNLVQHNLIADDGVSFRFRRDPAEAKIDFFASEDRWFRPVMARTGPDGALWVVDMYRYMIEHPQWLPQIGKDELRPWFRTGEDRGRIYKVVRTDRAQRTVPQFAGASTQQLVAALESSNGWQRDIAQRLLISQKSPAAIEPLRELASNSKQPLARLHALWTLNAIDALPASAIEAALKDEHAGVRRNAVRIAAQTTVDAKRLSALVTDSSAKVRLELASTLGEYDSPEASAAIAKLLIDSKRDRYISAAAMSSLNAKNVSAVLAAVIQSAKPDDGEVTSELIGQAVAIGDDGAIKQVVEIVCNVQNRDPKKPPFEPLSRILDGLAVRKWNTDHLPEPVRDRIAEIMQQARIIAVDDASSENVRAVAVLLLGREEVKRQADFQLMEDLLAPQSPVIVQRALVSHLARRGETAVAEILLTGWRSHSPELRSQILDVLSSRGPWAEVLRQHLEAGKVRAFELNAPVRLRLLELAKNSPKWQSVLEVKASTSRAEILRQYQPALKLAGDAKRGAAVFRKQCITCHKFQDEGFEVGPQLASITSKTKESLFAAILDPSAAVDAKYFSYVIVTNDGRSLSGRLGAETGSSVTLLAAGGKTETILRRDIDELRASDKSLMPEGLEQQLKPQDLADVIEFVRQMHQK